MIPLALLNKYNIPVPRYTSYPTVPFWTDNMHVSQWRRAFRDQFRIANDSEGMSLYIHLPFCESLCTYCGCNKKITTNHGVEIEYIKALISEWAIYCELMEEVPVIREIHLGGGTPTFFSPDNLSALLRAVLDNSIIHPTPNFSFEGHPNNTTREQLQTLFDWGFRRVSYGVQDNDPVVQKAINRIQPVEQVKKVTEMAREIGYTSVNYDLIYGLPFQTLSSIRKTVEDCISLHPDRFAFYSYAHVPWTSKGQRLFDENDLPSAEDKMNFYQEGVRIFEANNYHHIGLDHFVVTGDDLLEARNAGTLNRNFMGYTAQHANLQLGLGVSAISDSGHAFAQNSKSLHDYYKLVNNKELPVIKGYFLNSQDERFKKYILDISCQGRTYLSEQDKETLQAFTFPQLKKLEQDGLVQFNDLRIEVTELGKSFIRNICMAFDLHLHNKSTAEDKQTFSKAI
jgi:oxygen-independent coproporphyrinogen III oxidase